MNKIYLRLSIVPTDDCELFLRFGGAKADVDKNSNVNNLGYIFGESDNSFSVGCGTKITINKSDNASWGFIAQLSGVDITDFDKFSGIILGTPITVSPEAEVLEAQFAIGPTVKLADNAAIYGGAMFHILDGEAKFKGKVGKASVTFGTTDLEQNSFGGYVGMGLQIAENSNLNFEYQATGDSYAFGAGMVFKFGKVSPDIPKTKRLEDERGTVPPKQSTLQQKEVPLSEPIDKNKTLIGYRVQTDKYGRRTRIPVYEEDEKKK